MRPWIPPALCLACVVVTASPARAVSAAEARTQSFKLQSEGMRLYKEGKFKDATLAFQQVVNLNLNSFLAFYYLGICLNADRRYGEAIEPLKIALDLQPDYVQAHLALGDAYLKQGDTGEARAEYLRALELQPNYAAALDGLGRLLETTGQDDKAEEQYRKSLEINVAFADAYTHLGDLYLRKNRPEDAIQLFLKAISVKPDFSSAYARLGVAYGKVKQYDDAIAAIRKSQTLTPEDPEPYASLARIYLELQSFRRSEAQIQAALALDHDHPGAHLLLSDLKRAQEDFASAVEVLEGLYERGITDALMRRAVGDALKRARLDETRYKALKGEADRAPASPWALTSLARFLSEQGAHRRAAECLLRVAGLVEATPPPALMGPTPAGEPLSPPPTAPRARFEAGVELLAARVYPQAVDLFESLAAAPPENAPPPVAPSSGVPSQPDADLRSAALFNLGVARASLRLDEQAIQAFTSYLAGPNADARAYLYLGNACLRLGRSEEARAAYSSFVERAAPGPETVRVKRILETIVQDGKRPAAPGTP